MLYLSYDFGLVLTLKGKMDTLDDHLILRLGDREKSCDVQEVSFLEIIFNKIHFTMDNIDFKY